MKKIGKLVLCIGVISAFNSALATEISREPLVIDMEESKEKVPLVVQNCRSGYYPVFSVGPSITWKTARDSKADYYSTFYQTVTAECAPKTCEYNYSWLVTRGTVTLLPEGREIGRYNSKEEMKRALKKFINDGVCINALGATIRGL